MQQNTTAKYDVVIVGGGLAGLSLAIQLKRTRPKTTIAVVERMAYPFPEAAHKVGESTTEGSAFYFSNLVGMKDHLEKEQLPKIGFRFFSSYGDNSDITQRGEIGNFKSTAAQYPHPSYQLDRGRFENALAVRCQDLGVQIIDRSVVQSVAISGTDGHHVKYRHNDMSHTIDATWFIDASGRAATLKNQMSLRRQERHDANSSWMRVDQVIDINTWTADKTWRARPLSPRQRFFCTTHLCGPGYWVWIIPLASAVTSIGIVADPKYHPLSEFQTLEGALAWLERHEPELRTKINTAGVKDFIALKHYAHRCKQVFSVDKWAITGVAGVFTDPLYSPGSELIAVSNIMITDLITRSLNEEPVAARAERLNEMFLEFWFEMSVTDFVDQYGCLGSFPIIAAKKIWNAGWFWGLMGLLIFQNKIWDYQFVDSVWPELSRFLEIHRRTTRFLAAWAESERSTYRNQYVDYTRMKFLQELHSNMSANLSADELRTQIRRNTQLMEFVAADFYRQCPLVAEQQGLEITDNQSDVAADVSNQLRLHVWSRACPDANANPVVVTSAEDQSVPA